ncbi:hypothetical protein [Rhodospirillum centenum]|uniref:Uncharacterized protein n=1 Tax=Rhodospirillum centenum (strain ATCC 51521 / SW) TaxID=414684 RepID=B6IPB6_RHOCS|nr:hypothetical protein [Rhodospirillum centenum]ACI99618.1 conserved hypothetical protein [Rhodospirillum centenum SW]
MTTRPSVPVLPPAGPQPQLRPDRPLPGRWVAGLVALLFALFGGWADGAGGAAGASRAGQKLLSDALRPAGGAAATLATPEAEIPPALPSSGSGDAPAATVPSSAVLPLPPRAGAVAVLPATVPARSLRTGPRQPTGPPPVRPGPSV